MFAHNELDAAVHARNRFLATVSHELRTPLTHLIGLSAEVLEGDLDCNMPILDGFPATRAIRLHEGATRHTPIVALTAAVAESERNDCLGAGMDGYLAKPANREQIESMLRTWVRGAFA